MSDQLTNDDKSQLAYYWQHKGDLERWEGWERVRPVIERDYPGLLNAWMNYQSATRDLDQITAALMDEYWAGELLEQESETNKP